MRKRTTKFFTALLLVVFSVAFLSFQPLMVQAEERDILVETDLRIELLTIVQYLGDNPLLTRYDFPYRQEMIKKFLPFKSHFAVAYAKMLFERGFSFDAPPTVMLHLSQPPELKVVIPFTEYLLKRGECKENLDKFVDGLRVFVKETNFMKVMEEFKPYFKIIESRTRQKFDGKKYLKQLEDYYGYGQHSYHIILGSFLHCGGYGPSIARGDGSYDVYSIIGPCEVIEDYPDFGGTDFFESLLFHEFSHSFINPITTTNLKEVNTCQKLYSPISTDMQRLAYGTWETCLNEHLVRIFTARIALVNKGEETYVKELENDIQLGFVYLPYLDDLFQTFELNRTKYPTIKDFYPEIIQLLKKLTTYPSIPTGFKFSTTGLKGVGLEWKDNARDEDGFRIYRSNQKTTDYQILVELPKNAKAYDDFSIQPGGNYWYKLTAFNRYGEIEVFPILTKIQISAPPEPTNFHYLSVKGQTMTLAWEFKSKCTGFILYEMPDKTEIQKLKTDQRTITFQSSSYGEKTYMLQAYNQSEDEIKYCTKEPSVTLVVLQPPEKLSAKSLGDAAVKLFWELNENFSDQLAIYRKSGTGEFTLLTTIPRADDYTDNQLDPATEYEYKIVAKKGETIQSDESATIKVKTEPKRIEYEEIVIKLKVGEQGVFLQDGRVFVPLRFIAEAFGSLVEWRADEQKIIITTPEVKVELWIGKNLARVNGVERQIDPNNPKIMLMVKDGKTYSPLRFVGESLGCSVVWDAKKQEVTLIYKRRIK